MADMSPELDLLERLSALDADLHESAYGSCFKFHDLAHARRVVVLYISAGFVELYDNRSESRAAIPLHTGRWILQDDSSWESGSTYSLRMTDDGYNKFVDDSKGFFDQLFS